MRDKKLIRKLEPILNDNDHSFLSYNSLPEEALKLALRAMKSDRPLIVVKENNYLVNKLREVLLSYFEEEEIVTYLPEESLRAEEIASSFENRANRLNSLYRILHEKKIRLVLVSPYGLIRHLPDKEELKEKIL
ncbi:MAG: hypothetical protein II577_03740, partial [Erysipelotrichaceae bacterium]|nr:hypothetical protein [Erysipelotrichaceae bacterium]